MGEGQGEGGQKLKIKHQKPKVQLKNQKLGYVLMSIHFNGETFFTFDLNL
jgi:hypothetical protein